MAIRERLLELALKGLEAERARIDDEIDNIRYEIGNGSTMMTAGDETERSPRRRRRRKMSTEARRRISEAMKRSHKERTRAAAGPRMVKKTGGLTAAGRKK